MGLIKKLLSGTVGQLAKDLSQAIDPFVTSKEEKMKLQMQMEEILQRRESEIEQTVRQEMASKERILVAELTQGDKFTKRARPTILYSGVVFTFINYVLFPIVAHFTGNYVPQLELPTEFWWAWTGFSSTYVVGRSAEKFGAKNKLVSTITGNP